MKTCKWLATGSRWRRGGRTEETECCGEVCYLSKYIFLYSSNSEKHVNVSHTQQKKKETNKNREKT